MWSLGESSATDAAGVAAVLHRGLWARLRTIRLYEIAAWIAVIALVVGARDGIGSGGLGLWFVGVAGAVVRLAIAIEYVRCDRAGVTWRTLFVTHRVSWSEIGNIEVVPRPLSLPFRGTRGALSTILVIERRTEPRQVYVHPSLLVSMPHLGEFVAAARLMSPSDWTLSDEDGARSGGGHHPSGKRVGRPTRQRRR